MTFHMEGLGKITLLHRCCTIRKDSLEKHEVIGSAFISAENHRREVDRCGGLKQLEIDLALKMTPDNSI